MKKEKSPGQIQSDGDNDMFQVYFYAKAASTDKLQLLHQATNLFRMKGDNKNEPIDLVSFDKNYSRLLHRKAF